MRAPSALWAMSALLMSITLANGWMGAAHIRCIVHRCTFQEGHVPHQDAASRPVDDGMS